jgi:hypothetical protein
VDARHIVPYAVLVAHKLAHALKDVIGGREFFVDQAELQALRLRPVDEQMQVVLHRIFELNDTGERNRALQALLGRAWMENVGVLKMLANEGYAPAVEQAKKLHVFFDDKAAREAHVYRIEMGQLKAEISGMELVIGRSLIGPISKWIAMIHTVSYEVELLKIGLKAQAVSMLNVGGVFNSELDKLAQKATDVFVAEHNALIRYRQDIESLAEGARTAESGLEAGRAGGAGGRTKKQAEATREYAEAATKLTTALPPVIAEMERIEKSKADEEIRKQATALLDFGKNFQPLASGPLALPPFNASLATSITLWQQLPPYVERQTSAVTRLSAAHKELMMVQKLATTFQNEWKASIQASVAAVQQDVAGNIEDFSTGLAKLIGGRKAQAGVEALWEVARGIACIAEGTWPPNPAAIIAAGLHFEAAVQYALIEGRAVAGTARAPAPVAIEASTITGSTAVVAGSARAGKAWRATALLQEHREAMGGRLNVYVVGDEAGFIAERVNAADQAGHFMQVTSSRRSAPAAG